MVLLKAAAMAALLGLSCAIGGDIGPSAAQIDDPLDEWIKLYSHRQSVY
jgi:hypothetical protein